MRNFSRILAVLLGTSFSLLAASIPYPTPGKLAPGQTLLATTSGDVIAYFYASGAKNIDQVGLFVNGHQLGSWVFNNQTASFGQTVDFGYVAAGSTLNFAIDDLSTKKIFYSDPSLNSDGKYHAYATAFSSKTSGGITIPAGVYIGFEDTLYPKADLNYTDEQIVVPNISTIAVSPEPAPVSAVGFGLVCIAVGSLRRRSSTKL